MIAPNNRLAVQSKLARNGVDGVAVDNGVGRHVRAAAVADDGERFGAVSRVDQLLRRVDGSNRRRQQAGDLRRADGRMRMNRQRRRHARAVFGLGVVAPGPRSRPFAALNMRMRMLMRLWRRQSQRPAGDQQREREQQKAAAHKPPPPTQARSVGKARAGTPRRIRTGAVHAAILACPGEEVKARLNRQSASCSPHPALPWLRRKTSLLPSADSPLSLWRRGWRWGMARAGR